MSALPSTILHVEDHEATRDRVRSLLQQAGFTVREAVTGREALQLAAEHPALILLDVELPDMSSFEVCRQLKTNPATTGIPIVYRSAVALPPEDKITWLESGAIGYLIGDDPHELLATIQAVLRMREAEAALGASEQRFRALVESVQDYAIFFLDAAGLVISWNSGAERIKGYRAEEILGHHFSCFYPVEDQAQGKPEQGLRSAATAGRFAEEGWRVRKDGTRFWATVLLTAVRDASGQVQGYAKVTRDLTACKQAGDALREATAQYCLLFDQYPTPLWIFAADTLQILAVNEAAIHRLGYTREQLLAMTIGELRPTEELPAFLSAYGTAAETRGTLGLSFTERKRLTLRKQDGTLVDAQVRWAPLTFGGHAAWLAVAEEIVPHPRNTAVVSPVHVSDEHAQGQHSAAARYGVALGSTGLAILVRELLMPLWGMKLPFILLYPAALMSTWYGGLGPGLLTTVLCALAADYLWLPPRYAFFNSDGADSVGLLLATGIMLLIVGLIEQRRKALAKVEHQVQERTTELVHANATLRAEMTARTQAEDALRQVQGELEHRIQERTEALAAANAALRQEIAERHQAEAAVRASAARMQAIVDTAVDGIITINERGQIESCNPVTEQLFGYTAQELLGKNVKLLMPAPYREEHDSYLANYLRTGEAKVIGIGREVVGLRRDGTTFPLELAVSEVRLPDRRLFTGIVRDVSARKEAEDSLRQSEERFRVALQSSPIVVFQHDRELRYSWLYHATPGFTNERVLGKTDAELLTPEYAGPLMAMKRRVLETGVGAREEVSTADNSPLRYHDLSVEPLRDTRGQIVGLTCAAVDITERKQEEERQTQLLAEVQRANEELQQFAYIVSHDLSEPLRTMASYIELLTRRYQGQLDTEADEYLAFAVDGARRMQQMITALLAYTRVGGQVAEFTAVDCEVLLAQVVSDLQVALTEQQATLTHDPLPMVTGDATRLKQVFQNLIGNALKFRREESPRIHIAAQRLNGQWQFSVRDNGIGLEPQHAERIFQIFQRLHPRKAYPGTGVGLAICKKIVERHGGRIWVESQPRQGATFFFTLPAYAPDPSEAGSQKDGAGTQ